MLRVGAAGLLLLAACGGDDDDGADDDGGGSRAAYVEGLATFIRESRELPFEAGQAECMATAVVDVIGTDALADAGISPEELADAEPFALPNVDLPDDAADRVGTGLLDCDLVAPVRDGLIDRLGGQVGTELPPEAATCLADNLDDRAVTTGMARTFFEAAAALGG